MKKLSLIVLLFFVYVIGNSQNTSTQNLGAPRTLVVNKGGLKSDSALILPSFPDTASANQSQYVKYYAGNVIRVGDTVYVRNNTATKWVKISAGNATTPSLQQVTNVDSITNRVVSVRELNLLDVSGSGSYDLNLKGYNMGFAITDKNAEQIFKINGTGVGTPKLYFGESGASATLIPAGNNPQLNLPSINGTLALLSDIIYPDTTVIATHTYVYNSTKTKIDSLKRSTDSVFAQKNGSWVFQYKDSIGGDTATVVLAYVTNAEATTITRGTVVYLFGATGDRASVKRANNKSDTTSSKTFAIVRDDITAGGTGYVVTQGQCAKLNLGSYSAGDIVYLDSISGHFTKNKPAAPYHQVFLGVVERANNGNGLLYVKPQNGYELGELHNVSVNSQNNNDVLYYDSVPKLWKAKSPYQLVDTSKLSARIDLRMRYTDTANMLSTYQRSINAVKYSDTASILSTYQRSITAVKYSDTTSLIATKTNLLSEVNVSDTANMLLPYLRKIDTSSLSSRINTKQNTITLTTTGTSGASTFSSNTLNIPNYSNNDALVAQAYGLLGSTIKGINLTLPNYLMITGTAQTLASGTIRFIAYYLPNAQTITGVKWWQGTIGNYTANNYNGVGLYSYSGGTLTLVASSTNDGAIWQTAATNSMGSKAFSSPYSAAAGIYFIAVLYSSSAQTTAPTIASSGTNTQGAMSAADFTNSAKLTSSITGQTALPNTQASSGLTGGTASLGVWLY